MAFGLWTRVNTIEPSMFGGDAAFLSNYFDHLFTFARHTFSNNFYHVIRQFHNISWVTVMTASKAL